MKSKRIPLILILLSLGIFGCNFNSPPSELVPEDEKQESEEQKEEEEEQQEEESKVYEKDEQGFYILEDDYFSYNEDSSDTKKVNKVHIPELVSEQPTYSQMRLYIGDKQVPVYNVKTNFSQTWNAEAPNRINNAVASFGLEGKVTLKLQLSFNSKKHIVIRPLDKEVAYSYDESRRVISFTITSDGQYTIDLTNDRVLHLFVNKMNVYTNPFSDAIVFKKGIHNHSNDNRINSSNQIWLSSGQKVYIEDGAFVQAKFISNNSSNIQIAGPGYIDGAVFDRNANTGTVLVPIEFNYCSNITLKDFTVIDPAGWCFNMYFCTDSTIDNCKVISSRSNGDGISLQSCSRFNVTNCFVRSWDDSLVVKNYPRWDNRSVEGSTSDILFDNCVLWTDLAQSMEVGFECVGETMKDITFQNITVLHNFHKPVFSIHDGNNANINNVKYKNITVEDASVGRGDGNATLVEFSVLYSSSWSDQHKVTSLGKVENIELDNVLVLEGKINPEVKISGCIDPREGYSKDVHYVKNVTFKDFSLYGTLINKSYTKYTEQYVQNVSFTTSGNKITGHQFDVIDVSEYGNNIMFIN